MLRALVITPVTVDQEFLTLVIIFEKHPWSSYPRHPTDTDITTKALRLVVSYCIPRNINTRSVDAHPLVQQHYADFIKSR